MGSDSHGGTSPEGILQMRSESPGGTSLEVIVLIYESSGTKRPGEAPPPGTNRPAESPLFAEVEESEGIGAPVGDHEQEQLQENHHGRNARQND